MSNATSPGEPARVQDPQAVLAPLTASAIFLVATIDTGGEDVVRDLLPDLAGLARTVGSRVAAGLTLVTGIGAGAWDRLFAGPKPAELHPFAEIRGARHTAVSTPGDLLFHIRAEQADLCFELAALIGGRLAGAATVVDEVHGFKYFDHRSIVGFVDGTENPVAGAAERAVTVGAEDPDFAGSSYVIVQKYFHDLDAWNALAVEDQERAIGRRKLSNIELSDEDKPSNAHIALNVVEDADGNELKILRDNMAFGAVGRREFGTFFIGYSSTPSVTELLLERMFIGDPPGNHDRLLDFSTAVTGSLFFVPTAAFLDDLPSAPGATAAGRAPGAPVAPAVPDDVDAAGPPPSGNLTIGSLRNDGTTAPIIPT